MKEQSALHEKNPHTLRLQPDTRFNTAFSRIIDYDSASTSQYVPNQRIRTVLHYGQLKLLLAELEFLTIAYEHFHKEGLLYDSKGAMIKPLVVYMGAAAGHHHPALHRVFNQIDWVLIDPNEFKFSLDDVDARALKYNGKQRAEFPKSSNHGRVILFRTYFTVELAELIKDEFEDRTILFISDIRSSERNPRAFEESVLGDLELQRRGCMILQPFMSSLKFRTPYEPIRGLTTLEYYAGKVYTQTRQGASSTESRLIYRGNQSMRKYDYNHYENIFFHFNSITRMELYHHGVQLSYFDNCYDCAAESYVWARAMQLQYIMKQPENTRTIEEWSKIAMAIIDVGSPPRECSVMYNSHKYCTKFIDPTNWHECGEKLEDEEIAGGFTVAPAITTTDAKANAPATTPAAVVSIDPIPMLDASTVDFDKLEDLTPLQRKNPHTMRIRPDTHYSDYTRTIDYDTAPEIEYKESKYASRTTIHWGYRKVFLMMIEAITIAYEHIMREPINPVTNKKRIDERITIVTKSSIKSLDLVLFHEYFPNVDWVMIDANPHEVINDETIYRDVGYINKRVDYQADDTHGAITIILDTFSDELAETLRKELDGRIVLYISFYRTFNTSLALLDNNVNPDQADQERIIRKLRPYMSLYNYRVPFNKIYGDVEHNFDGKLYTEPFGGTSSTEACLIFRGVPTKIREYQHARYDNIFSYHNNFTRMCLYQHGLEKVRGLDQCHDCATEAYIWGRITQLAMCTKAVRTDKSPEENAEYITDLFQPGKTFHARIIRYQGRPFCTSFIDPTLWRRCDFIPNITISPFETYALNPDLGYGIPFKGGKQLVPKKRAPLKWPAPTEGGGDWEVTFIEPPANNVSMRNLIDLIPTQPEFGGNTDIPLFFRKNPHLINNTFTIHYSNLERTIDLDTAPRLKYTRENSAFFNQSYTCMHWGQRKLALEEIEFLSIAYEHLDRDYKDDALRPLAVYVGAAPCTHFPPVARLFPFVDWILVDPRDMNFLLSDKDGKIVPVTRRGVAASEGAYGNIDVKIGYFTLELAQQIKDENPDRLILFVSDLRSGDHTNTRSEFEKRVEIDNELQNAAIKILQPYMYSVKFRGVYDGPNTAHDYPPGKIYIQSHYKANSSETRLVGRGQTKGVAGLADRKYEYIKIEETMLHFNRDARRYYYSHGAQIAGIDTCHSCASEILVWARIVQQRMHPRISKYMYTTIMTIEGLGHYLSDYILNTYKVQWAPLAANGTHTHALTFGGKQSSPIVYKGAKYIAEFISPNVWFIDKFWIRNEEVDGGAGDKLLYGGALGFIPQDSDDNRDGTRLEDNIGAFDERGASLIGFDPRDPDHEAEIHKLLGGGDKPKRSAKDLIIPPTTVYVKTYRVTDENAKNPHVALVIAARKMDKKIDYSKLCSAVESALGMLNIYVAHNPRWIGSAILYAFSRYKYKRVICITEDACTGDTNWESLLEIATPAAAITAQGLRLPMVIEPAYRAHNNLFPEIARSNDMNVIGVAIANYYEDRDIHPIKMNKARNK